MKLSDFDFDLPEDLIATRPAVPRSSARLLVAEQDRITDARVTDLLQWLNAGDRLVLNDTRVIPARLSGQRHRTSAQGPVSARIEVTLLYPQADGCWSGLLKPLKKIKIGETVRFSDALSAELVDVVEGQGRLRFNLAGDDFDAALAEAGAMPLPPYIAAKRPADEQDKTDYQTVWARSSGAVAAPTASLHFDEPLLAALAAKGVEFTYVTLHVGAGTFLPVKVEDVTSHKMHAEWGQVTAKAAAEIAATIAATATTVAAATAAHIRESWDQQPEVIVVEPEAAPCLLRSVAAGALTRGDGPVSAMGRLDCKDASLLAYQTLRHDADRFVTVTEDQAAQAVTLLAEGAALATTPSGAAGLAALLAADLPAQARVLVILSEGPEG